MRKILVLIAMIFVVANGAFSQETSVKLVGQVVCSSCWFEEDDRNINPYGNAADLKCARECSDKGLPQALAVKTAEGKFELYNLEKGAFKLKENNFLAYLPKTVEIEGTVRTAKEGKYLKVDSIRVVRDIAPELPKVENEIASLVLDDMNGVAQDLNSLKGRYVVVNFWATWCAPCKKEMPDLAKIQNEFAPFGVQVIGAAGDVAKDRAIVLKFILATKVNFPVWLGANTQDLKRFGLLPTLPGTAIVDREGKIVWRKSAQVTAAELRKVLNELIGNSDPAETKTAAIKTENSSAVPA